jgi:hypothetical protein
MSQPGANYALDPCAYGGGAAPLTPTSVEPAAVKAVFPSHSRLARASSVREGAESLPTAVAQFIAVCRRSK